MKSKAFPTLFVLLLSLSFVPQGLVAQRFCRDAADEADCEKKVRDALLKGVPVAKRASDQEAAQTLKDLTAAKAKEAAAELLSKVAPEIAVLPGASAAFEDFLGRLKIGVTSEGPSNMQALALDFTNFLGLSTDDGYKLQAVARPPALFEPLSTKLSVENRDKRTKGLGFFDDVLVAFDYSPSTIHLGKNVGANQLLIDDLFQQFLAETKPLADEATKAKDERENLAARLQRDFPSAFSDQDELRQFDLIPDTARRQEYRDAVERAEVAEAKRLSSLSKILHQREFFEIADLVANQPQLVFKATRTVRDKLTGPEETTFHAAYEQGFVNMNSLRRALTSCRQEMTTCYADYLNERRMSAAKDQNRLTVSLDWTKRGDFHRAIDGVSVDAPGSERWTFEGAYGRNLRVDVNGKFTSRFDLTGSWEDWSDDPMHQNRGLAKLSLTQKVTGDMSLVLGAVWASKPEFRGEVDKAISARFGLTYRFLDKAGKTIMKNN
jgi:hypothetical protein